MITDSKVANSFVTHETCVYKEAGLQIYPIPRCPDAKNPENPCSFPVNILKSNLPLLNSAPHQALVDAKGDAPGDCSANGIDILAANLAAEHGGNEIAVVGEELVGDLAGAKVLIGERSDEDGVLALGVELGVDAALVEGGHVPGAEVCADDAPTPLGVEHAVLGRHLGDEAAADDNLQLGAAGVHVERVDAARPDRPDRHARVGAHERREGAPVRRHQHPASAGVALLLVEGEDEVFILGQEGETVCGTFGGKVVLCQHGKADRENSPHIHLYIHTYKCVRM